MKNMFQAYDKCKRIQLLPDEILHAGIDVHKGSCYVAVWSSKRELLCTFCMPVTPEGLDSLLRRFADQLLEIVYEAGPTGFGLARFLEEQGYQVNVISAAHTPITRDAKATASTVASWPNTRPKTCSAKSTSQRSNKRTTGRSGACASK